ncbi:MAG: hypothetical protein ABWX74_20890 [Aeromicrobium sp.]
MTRLNVMQPWLGDEEVAALAEARRRQLADVCGRYIDSIDGLRAVADPASDQARVTDALLPGREGDSWTT